MSDVYMLCTFVLVDRNECVSQQSPCFINLLAAPSSTCTTKLLTPGLNDSMKSCAGLDYLHPIALYTAAPSSKSSRKGPTAPLLCCNCTVKMRLLVAFTLKPGRSSHPSLSSLLRVYTPCSSVRIPNRSSCVPLQHLDGGTCTVALQERRAQQAQAWSLLGTTNQLTNPY